MKATAAVHDSLADADELDGLRPDPAVRDGIPTDEMPRTDTEQWMCRTFADLLGTKQISVVDSFFDNGGHSLLAERLMALVRTEFGIDVPLRTVFAKPTAAGLAEFVDLATARLREPTQVALPPISPQPEHALTLSANQRDQLDAHDPDNTSPTDNVAFGAELTGPIDVAALRLALNDVLGRHRILRTVYDLDRRIADHQLVPRATISLTELWSTDSAQDILLESAQIRIDITRDAPVRADLIKRSEVDALLVIVIHHIACDRWSMPVLLGDLATAYRARHAGTMPRWAPLALQHNDFAVWQSRLPTLADASNYWADELGGAPGCGRGSQAPFACATAAPPGVGTATLAPNLQMQGAFDELAKHGHTSARTVAMSAVAVILHLLTGRDDIVIWSPVPEAAPRATDGIIGPWVNDIAIRIAPNSHPNIRSLLFEVRGKISNAVAYSSVTAGTWGIYRPTVIVDDAPPMHIQLTRATRLTAVRPEHPGSVTDITFIFSTPPAGLECQIKYRRDRYTTNLIDAVLSLLPHALDTMAYRPRQPISTLPRRPRGTH